MLTMNCPPSSRNQGSEEAPGNIHIIVISSVRPAPTSAGQIILQRHLIDQDGITLEVHGGEPVGLSFSMAIRRIGGILSRFGLKSFVEDLWVLLAGRWIDSDLPRSIASPKRTIVLTVAHGDSFMAAMRFSKRHHLPLVAWFHDWWPDIAEVHGFARRRLERKFRELANESAAVICISEGINRNLVSQKCVILPPIPAARKAPSYGKVTARMGEKFRVLYSGNLSDYGPMLGEALKALEGNEHVELVVRGARPKWSADFAAEMKRQERWLEFAPREELEAWLASADAFLVPMEFDPELRRRMETSFPSKLIEFAQFGKPLVVWGPEYCSAIEWARRTNGALCITNGAPQDLREHLEKLSRSLELQQQLATIAENAAATEFCHEKIQSNFRLILDEILCKQPAEASPLAVVGT